MLDPRPESEALVDRALAALPPGEPARILDLGVGSGCLLLSVLAERPLTSGLGVDLSPEALAVAAANAAALGVADRAVLQRGDWTDGLAERFDLVLCNPPYIAADEIPGLAPEVRLWEPHLALSPGADPLAAYRRLAPEIATLLVETGEALFEIGLGQAKPVGDLFRAADLTVDCFADLGGTLRVVCARRAPERRAVGV